MRDLFYDIKCLILILILLPIAGFSKGDVCPLQDFSIDPKILTWERPEDEKPVDQNQELKDLGTDIVVRKFFTTPETMFNFIKLVYGDLDDALKNYRKNNNLDDRAIFLTFKGGNVLRMIANGVFDLLPSRARDLLKAEYTQYFKRSDADFSVYVDEEKLGDLDYDKVLNEISDLVFLRLNKIRNEFKRNSQKYFNLFQVKPEVAIKELNSYFDQLKDIEAIKDKTNDKWFNAKFIQLQFVDGLKAKANLSCPYQGQYDYKYEIKKDKAVATPVSKTPNWIVNSDNRIIESVFGTDKNKLTKFYLLRSKIVFEYIYEKDGVFHKKPIGGELIDVSLTHRNDSALRDFLNNYDKEVTKYTLISPTLADEKIVINSYSPSGLARDLQIILFDNFDRPWHGGLKYMKRVYRFFFLSILEMLHDYGLNSIKAKEYINNIKEKIIGPLYSLYPLNKNSKKVAKEIIDNADQVALEYGDDMEVTNRFWQALGKLLDDLIKNPQADDQEGFKDFLMSIEKNIDIALKLEEMPEDKTLFKKIFQVGMDKLF